MMQLIAPFTLSSTAMLFAQASRPEWRSTQMTAQLELRESSMAGAPKSRAFLQNATAHADARDAYDRTLNTTEGNETRGACRACAEADRALMESLQSARDLHATAETRALALADAAHRHEVSSKQSSESRKTFEVTLKQLQDSRVTYKSSEADFNEFVGWATSLQLQAQEAVANEMETISQAKAEEEAQEAYPEAAFAADMADDEVAAKASVAKEACAGLGLAPVEAPTPAPEPVLADLSIVGEGARYDNGRKWVDGQCMAGRYTFSIENIIHDCPTLMAGHQVKGWIANSPWSDETYTEYPAGSVNLEWFSVDLGSVKMVSQISLTLAMDVGSRTAEFAEFWASLEYEILVSSTTSGPRGLPPPGYGYGLEYSNIDSAPPFSETSAGFERVAEGGCSPENCGQEYEHAVGKKARYVMFHALSGRRRRPAVGSFNVYTV